MEEKKRDNPDPTTPKDKSVIVKEKQPLTIHDLGWTKEQAIAVRGQMAAFAEIWDDPIMDIYDED